MCSGFLVIDVFPLLLCVFLLDGSASVLVGLSPCTALLVEQCNRINKRMLVLIKNYDKYFNQIRNCPSYSF